MSYIKKLAQKELIKPPKFVKEQLQYETFTGSISYGIPHDTSDIDLIGWCIPDKDIIFPHLAGEIQGFGRQIQRFNQWQQHHIKDIENKKEYDISIYNIIRFFQLCMDNNPNMLETLFTPLRCVTFCTKIGDLVRENRKLFLHKGSWFKHKGYSFAQLHKMRTKTEVGLKELSQFESTFNITNTTTIEEIEQEIMQRKSVYKLQDLTDNQLIKYRNLYLSASKRAIAHKLQGYSTKFAAHTVRLLNQVEQILVEHDLDLERNREQLKAIRRGEWTTEEVLNYANQKERDLETVYSNSKLRNSPDEGAIKTLLLNCLEMHFGSLDKVISIPNSTKQLISDIELLLNKYKGD